MRAHALLAALLLAAGCDARESAAQRSSGMSPEAYDAWRRPDRVVAALDLARGQTVADVGAGTGYLTLRLAEAVGPTGRVVATDIDPDALAALARLPQPGTGAPIDVRRVLPGEPGLEQARYDRILLAQVDHMLPDRVDYLRRLRAALAPGGRVAIANRIHHRAALLSAAAAAGYAVTADITDLPGQFLILLAPDRETTP